MSDPRVDSLVDEAMRLRFFNLSRTAGHHYWGRTWYVWNNTGDRATLLNAGGTVIDRCAYSGAGDEVGC